jgi:hypothetical protein
LVSDIKGRTQAEMFENGVLRGIIGPRRVGWREGVTGNWRKLHNEKLHDLYSSPNV